jgi:hypothetical protein
MSRRALIHVAIAALLVASDVAAAQLTSGTIIGTITDQTGGALPGVQVSVNNIDTGATRALVTNERGRYEAPDLPVGNYQVTATLQGFQTAARRGIELTVGRNLVVDFNLKLGEIAQEVTVTADVATVETVSATVANLIDAKKVQDLPLINRDLTQLTFMQPGVVKIPSSGSQGVFGGMGDKFSVAGARGTQNLYLLDGVSNSDLSGNAQGASGSYVGAETVKEIQIVTNNYSAEYRSAAGGIVSAITKSGTNSFHGSAFEFHRDDRLDAANFFDKAFGNPKPDFRRNQYGGSLGGPIVRNRTFFFTSYEGLGENLGTTESIRVPTALARQGILPGRTVTVNRFIRPYLDLWPLPGQGNTLVRDFGDGTALVAGTSTTETVDDFFAGKIDQQFTSTQTLSATYNWDKGHKFPIGVLKDVRSSGTSSKRNILGVRHTAVLTSAALNEFHFGASITEPRGDIPLTSRDFTGLTVRPDRRLVPELQVGSSGSGLATVGYRVDYSDYLQKGYTFKDGFSLVKGNHSFRTGGDVTYYNYVIYSCSRGCQGDWAFNSLEDLLVGRAQQFEVMLPGGDDPNRDLTQWLLAAYFQDNWKITNDLTLNLGLRYEFPTVPKEKNGKVSNLLNFSDDHVTVGQFFKNPTNKAFSPRVGFAWSPGEEKKWSLRSGFGVFYEHPMLYNIRTTLQELPPFTLVGRVRDTDAARIGQVVDFPNAFFTQQDLLRGQPNIRAMEYNLEPTHIYRWSATLQRDLGNGWIGTADYTASRGYNLWQQSLPNINKWQGWPDPVPSDEKFWPGGTSRINPAFGEMRIQYANARSWYNGGSFSLQKRLGEGLEAQASFTYSKARDQGSGVTSTGDELPQSQRGIYAWDLDRKTGLSAYDIRKVFTANASYELPFGKNLTGAAGMLAKGWQLNTVISLMDGYPLTVLDASAAQVTRIGDNEGLTVNLKPGGNPNPVSGDPTRYYDPTQFTPSVLGHFGNLGRNTLISPGLETVDLSLFKTVDLAGGHRFQVRLECFNLFNRANFGTPQMSPFTTTGQPDPNAGRITTTRTAARQIQLGVKYIF